MTVVYPGSVRSDFDRPAIERRREHVLRGLQAALLRFEIQREAMPDVGLERAAIDVLRTLDGFGLELRRRVIR
jgi:hypothetical protein